MSKHSYVTTKDLPQKMREEIASGMIAPIPQVLKPPLRLCRFADKRRGYDGAISPWWIREEDLSCIFSAREASRKAHGGLTSMGLSLDIVARMALGVPQEWSDGRRAPLDILFQGDLKADQLLVFTGKGRAQRETAPNGLNLKWSPWSSITQIFIPALSSKRKDNAIMADVERILTIGAAKYFVSHQIY